MQKLIKWRWCLCSLIILSLQVNAQNARSIDKRNVDNLPVIPVGLDSYRMWDKWPQQRIGVRAYMRSTTIDKEVTKEQMAAIFSFLMKSHIMLPWM